MKFVIYKSAINLCGHWTNRVSILRGGGGVPMGQLLCSVNLALVLLKWEAKWACVLAFLPSFIKTVGGWEMA